MDNVEHILQFDVSTPHHAAQARRKLDALIIGGYEIISIQEQNIWDEETERHRRIRSVSVYGSKIHQTPDPR